MRRAKRPLIQKAVAEANAAVYHLTDPPGRPLDPRSPQDAELRKKWLDAYAAAGGAVEDLKPGQPVGSLSTRCPNSKWIELRYLHCNRKPVKGAQYHIRSLAFSADGALDENGFVHIDGVPDISGSFEYWFNHDPEEYKPRGPMILASTGTAKVEAVSAIDVVAEWLWGTVQGDFNKDQSVSQIAVNTVLGLIPFVDQALDLRDLISGVKDIIEFYSEEEQQQQVHEDVLGLSYETWLWIGVFLIALGCIPEVGSVVKGVLKGLIRFLQDAMKKAGNLSPAQLRRIWEELLKILNHLGIKQGNAQRWLKDLPGKLGGWMDEAAAKIRAALDAIRQTMDKAEEYAKQYAGKKLPLIGEILSADQAQRIIARAKTIKNAIVKAYNRLDEMKRRVNEWIREQIEHVLGGKHNFETNGSINTPAKQSGTNVRVQEETPPPEIKSVKEMAEETRQRELINELERQGVKHDPTAIVRIERDAQGKVIFLEKGNSKAGLQHILEEHADDFERRGIPREQIPEAVMDAVTKGKQVGVQGRPPGRPIYEIEINGKKHHIAVTTGNNGFIVGANPAD